MIVLYGAGQEFIKIVKENKVKFEKVIDTYSQKYPQGVCGYTIHDKNMLLDLTEDDYVCITSTKYFNEMFQIIREMNKVVTVINLYELNWMENKLPGLLSDLRNRDELYEPVEGSRIRQWLKETDDDEIKYWASRIPEVKEKGDKRFLEREFVYQYNPELNIGEDDIVLDVGAGPLPKFGNIVNGHKMNYIPLDPLAYGYKKLLDNLHIQLPIHTQFAMMEILTCFYPTESADYVIVNNALDHSIDIFRAFVECLDVVRVGGYLLLEHMEAEAAHNEYTGLHTWNISLIDGDVIFFDEVSKVNISKMFSECCKIDSKRIRKGYREMIIVKIHKKKPIPEEILREFNAKEFAGKIIKNMFERGR